MKKVKLKKKNLKEYLELAIPIYKKATNDQKILLLEHNEVLRNIIDKLGEIN